MDVFADDRRLDVADLQLTRIWTLRQCFLDVQTWCDLRERVLNDSRVQPSPVVPVWDGWGRL